MRNFLETQKREIFNKIVCESFFDASRRQERREREKRSSSSSSLSLHFLVSRGKKEEKGWKEKTTLRTRWRCGT
jgi:hypothetical protein